MTEEQRAWQEAQPRCPTCGEPAYAMSIGQKEIHPGDMSPLRVEALEGTETLECENGHYFTLSGHACGPPPEIIVKMDPL